MKVVMFICRLLTDMRLILRNEKCARDKCELLLTYTKLKLKHLSNSHHKPLLQCKDKPYDSSYARINN